MFIRTDRLLLRPGWAEEATTLHRLISDEAVARNLASLPWPYRLDDAARYLAAPQRSDAPQLLIFSRTMGQPRLVGGVGLTRSADGRSTELGYWIGRLYWGLGFATEAAQAVIAAARDSLRLPRIDAWHFCDNAASARVLGKLGFADSGQLAARASVSRGTPALARRHVLTLDDRAPDMAMPEMIAA